MIEDGEMKALHDVFEALKDLSDEGKKWVIESISKKFFPKGNLSVLREEEQKEKMPEDKKVDLKVYNSVADLFGRVSCKTAGDKVLVVASYLQEKELVSELTSRDIHKPLKHLGHPIKNITAALTGLIKAKPSLMLQVRKEGSSRQAIKKYKVTLEGLNKVKEMIKKV